MIASLFVHRFIACLWETCICEACESLEMKKLTKMVSHVLLAYFSFSSRSRREHYKIYFKFTKQYHVYRISTGNLLYRGIYVLALPLATSCQLLRLDEIPWRLITVHGCSIETLVDNRISISNKSADKRTVVAIRRSSAAANEILDVCKLVCFSYNVDAVA